MTRSRLYVLIDSLEIDIRRLLIRYLLDHLGELEALGEVSFERANNRREQDDDGTNNSIVEYLDLQEGYETLNRHRESLPLDLAREVRTNTQTLNSIVPVRNRVMHGRPLAAGDPELAVTACRSFVTRYWVSTNETLQHLVDDPTWEPAFEMKPAASDRILHNLPLPEYDETGLVGRATDCQEIVKHLRRRREPIVTIVGEGGIGKTAVALQVAYILLDDLDSPFECILWVSLKTEKLTSAGVVGIGDAVRDITGAARRLGEGAIRDFSGGISDLSALLEGVSALLIVDNLETISGAEVIALYEELPDSVSYLFTSRVGIGQFERRIVLNPLSERDSSALFRNLVGTRNVTRLAKLRNEAVQKIVGELRFSPLAIRWYVLSVEAGREPKPSPRLAGGVARLLR